MSLQRSPRSRLIFWVASTAAVAIFGGSKQSCLWRNAGVTGVGGRKTKVGDDNPVLGRLHSRCHWI